MRGKLERESEKAREERERNKINREAAANIIREDVREAWTGGQCNNI